MTDTKKKLTAIRTPLTKAQLFASIAEDTGLTKKEVAAVFESLGDHMHRHLKKRSAGAFTLPGLAKITVQSKKATKARPGRNPFTGEEIMVSPPNQLDGSFGCGPSRASKIWLRARLPAIRPLPSTISSAAS